MKTKDTYRCSKKVMITLFTLLCSLMLDKVSSATSTTTDGTLQGRRDKNDSGICGSMDIRNSVHRLEVMRGCRVIEGFVQILLIDHANETDYEAYSFPEIREITCYLLLYRVSGVKNLSQLFPNLSVIRGNKLFFDYALVIYEMFHLQEIGLTSMTAILRGGVRIEKNRSLCYVGTVDWLVMHSSADSKGDWDNYIADNEESVACPGKCPGCHPPNCWAAQQCQRNCPERCGQGVACDFGANGTVFCCHEECIGGCSGRKASECVSCRHVTYNETCISSCPKGTYRYLGRRCISEEECFNMQYDYHLLERDSLRDNFDGIKNSRHQIHEDDRSVRPTSSGLIPYDGDCIYECPPGTEEEADGRGCVPCRNGACRKRCQGENIESIASAQYYRGCTHIEGSIEINLQGRGGEQMVRELEESLGQVEEISGYLKVVRSVSLVSLDFLRNLRVVYGKNLENGRFAIIVQDNQNLRRLWNWDARNSNLTIANGRLFFHFNPRLCPSEIELLRRISKLGEHTDLEVDSSSNGDRGDCYEAELHAYALLRSPKKVTIRWQHFSSPEKLSFLGYTVNFIQVLEGEAKIEESDLCGNGWEEVFVMNDYGEKGQMQEHNLTNLPPFTRYAYYVKTYAMASIGSQGGRSKIQYFRTPPSKPTMPLHLSTKSLSDSSILLSWQAPIYLNGNFSHYQIVGMLLKEDEAFLEQRDYCIQPAQFKGSSYKFHHNESLMNSISIAKSILAPSSSMTNEVRKSDCCSDKTTKIDCKTYNYYHTGEEKGKHEFHACDNAMFDFIQSNEFYGDETISHFVDEILFDNFKSKEQNHERKEGGIIVYFNKQVYGLSYIANGLKNYGLYSFQVRICRQPYYGEGHDNSNPCSPAATATIRTLPLVSADSIRSVNVYVENGSYLANWLEPLNPNGAILTYNIEYQRHDIINVQSVEECITNKQYHHNKRIVKLQGLPDGEYSIRVRANSLFGKGPFLGSASFIIFSENSDSYDEGVLWGSIVGVAIVISVFATFLFILCRKQVKGGSTELKLIASVNPEYLETLAKDTYVADMWEVERSKVKLLKEVGQGSFGMVYEGVMENVNGKHLPWIPCAVKTVNDETSIRERIEFLNEATIMKTFCTHHVVKLLGVVSYGYPTLVIMELMAIGDLKTYLRKQREDNSNSLSLPRLLRMAAEVADGMAYLASRKFVHRDLAARNCMVGADFTVKVGDFGMARDIYETDYYRKGTKGLLPVRWMSPESLRDGIFTCQTDVWSYGIVVWEMSTLAAQPYQGLSNQEVLQFVIDGGVMNCPDQYRPVLNNIMRACWRYNPSKRPTFLNIISYLEPELEIDFQNVSFAHSKEGKIERRIQYGNTNFGVIEEVVEEDTRTNAEYNRVPSRDEEEIFHEM